MGVEITVLIVGIICVLVASFCAIFGFKKRGNPMEHDLLKSFEREANKQAERNALNEAIGQISPKEHPPFMPSKKRRLKDHEDFPGIFQAPPEMQRYERATIADLPLQPLRMLDDDTDTRHVHHHPAAHDTHSHSHTHHTNHDTHHHSDFSHSHDSSSHCDGGHDGGGDH